MSCKYTCLFESHKENYAHVLQLPNSFLNKSNPDALMIFSKFRQVVALVCKGGCRQFSRP